MERTDYKDQLERDVLAAMKKPSPWYWVALVFSAGSFLIARYIVSG